jgi:hypothetical protein
MYSIYSYRGWQPIQTKTLTKHLQWAVSTLSQQVGVAPTEISIQSLRASGAMALLCAEVNTDRICLLG